MPFAAGKTVLGTVELGGGKAKFTTTTLAAGASTVTATYNGDSTIANVRRRSRRLCNSRVEWN
jgi:hypothetical protein